MWKRVTVPKVWPLFLYFRFRSFPASGSDHVTNAAWEWESPYPSMARHPLVCQGLLIVEASQSHSDTPHSVGLLWMSDQSEAETSTWQHTTLTWDRLSCPSGIGTRKPSKRAAAVPRLRPRGPGNGSEIFTAGNYKLTLLLLLLTHRFSERNVICFSLAAKLFLLSKDLELTLQHDSKCKSYSLTLCNWTWISYCRV
jgi:hypothetical protein